MALTLSVSPRSNPDHKVSPRWWKERELLRTYPFQQAVNHGYLDYRLVLDKAAFVDVFLEQLPYYEAGIYSEPGWRVINQPVMAQLQQWVEQRPEQEEFEIHIGEWESGLT